MTIKEIVELLKQEHLKSFAQLAKIDSVIYRITESSPEFKCLLPDLTIIIGELLNLNYKEHSNFNEDVFAYIHEDYTIEELIKDWR